MTATAFVGATAAGFSGFFGGRPDQMRADLGDGMDWSAAGDEFSLAAILLLVAAGLAILFMWFVWSAPTEIGDEDRNGRSSALPG